MMQTVRRLGKQCYMRRACLPTESAQAQASYEDGNNADYFDGCRLGNILAQKHRVDQDTEQAYYTARLQIGDNLPPEISQDQIYPGMPVETFIPTEDRTFIEYLVRPVTDSFSRAFREE